MRHTKGLIANLSADELERCFRILIGDEEIDTLIHRLWKKRPRATTITLLFHILRAAGFVRRYHSCTQKGYVYQYYNADTLEDFDIVTDHEYHFSITQSYSAYECFKCLDIGCDTCDG